MSGPQWGSALAADRSDEKNPNWPPSATKDTDSFYRSRIGVRKTPFVPVRISEVSDVASNPSDAARRIDATNRQTTPHDLDAYRKDGQPGIGYYRLSLDPRDSSADRIGHNLVDQALAGSHLNNDPRARNYLSNAARAINMDSLTRTWNWGFGSAKFIRIAGSGKLTASVRSGTAKYSANFNLVGTFFDRTREIGMATLNSTAPASPSAVKTSKLVVDVFGRRIVDETISDKNPYVKPLRTVELVPQQEWWAGSLNIPWFDLAMAFKMTSDPVSITPRVAVGQASGAGEVVLGSGLETLGEVPLVSLWGFASIVARINFRPVDGQLLGGTSIGLVWNNAGRPLLRDARYAKAEISYGAVNLKIKAVSGFKVFGWTLWELDKTLWSVFQHDGKRSSNELLSQNREVALR